MSTIQQFNDTWHIRNQRLPVWTVVGDLLYFDNTGWHLRTAVTDPINGYVAVLDAWTDTWVISVANWVTTWSWGWSSNQVIYEDITNPAKTTNVSWGKRVGKIKWAAWWASLQYEWDSFFIDCFDNNEWDANNGLSIKNWTTVLGQDVGEIWDPAIVYNDREIPLDENKYIAFTFGKKDLSASVYNENSWYQARQNIRLQPQLSEYTHYVEDVTTKKWIWVKDYVHADEHPYFNKYWWQRWSYPKKADWTHYIHHQDIASLWTETSPDVFEQELIFNSLDGKYYLWYGWWQLPVVSNSSSDEIVTIDSSTWQVKRRTNGWGTLQTTVASGTTTPFVDFTTATFTLTLTKSASIQFNYRHNFAASVVWYYQVQLFEWATNLVPSFAEWTWYAIANPEESTMARSYSIDLPAWVHNLEVKVITSDVVSLQNQWLVDILYVY